MNCRYIRAGVICPREARKGWTTCNRHYTSGMNREQWYRLMNPRAVKS